LVSPKPADNTWYYQINICVYSLYAKVDKQLIKAAVFLNIT